DCDARLIFAAPRDAIYTIKIHDVNVKGGQAYTYRLTLTTGPSIRTNFPLGGRRGTTVTFSREGLGLVQPEGPIALPTEGAGSGRSSCQCPKADRPPSRLTTFPRSWKPSRTTRPARPRGFPHSRWRTAGSRMKAMWISG